MPQEIPNQTPVSLEPCDQTFTQQFLYSPNDQTIRLSSDPVSCVDGTAKGPAQARETPSPASTGQARQDDQGKASSAVPGVVSGEESDDGEEALAPFALLGRAPEDHLARPGPHTQP